MCHLSASLFQRVSFSVYLLHPFDLCSRSADVRVVLPKNIQFVCTSSSSKLEQNSNLIFCTSVFTFCIFISASQSAGVCRRMLFNLLVTFQWPEYGERVIWLAESLRTKSLLPPASEFLLARSLFLRHHPFSQFSFFTCMHSDRCTPKVWRDQVHSVSVPVIWFYSSIRLQ